MLECDTKPAVIYVIDGASTDKTSEVIKIFIENLNIVFISEEDNGIYDAMNKGKNFVETSLVHYLNSGDIVKGDPYRDILVPCLLKVMIIDSETKKSWMDHQKYLGFGYCHQGIIFPSSHPLYNIKYDIAADFDLICRLYPNGLKHLSVNNTGIVLFELGGMSSIHKMRGSSQIIKITYKNFSLFNFFVFLIIFLPKFLIPIKFRRLIMSELNNNIKN